VTLAELRGAESMLILERDHAARRLLERGDIDHVREVAVLMQEHS
jgi:hypothetical protein